MCFERNDDLAVAYYYTLRVIDNSMVIIQRS